MSENERKQDIQQEVSIPALSNLDQSGISSSGAASQCVSARKQPFNLHHNHGNTTLQQFSPIKSTKANDNHPEESLQLDQDTSYALRHESSVLNMSDFKYHTNNSGTISDEWSIPGPQQQPTMVDVKNPKIVNISQKKRTYTSQALKFHVPSNYSLHPARSPVGMSSIQFDQFETIFNNIYDIFCSIYTFFAMELSIQQKEELNRSILFPLEKISEQSDDKHNPIVTKCKSVHINCKRFKAYYHKIKYYFILFGFIAAIFTSLAHIMLNPSSERLLLNICIILWFLRFALILTQQRKCILSSYTEHIRSNTNSNKQSSNGIKFNWLEIHLQRISSNRGISRQFNKQFLSYAFIFCCFFVVMTCPILCYLILGNALDIINMPIISEVFLFPSNKVMYAIWIFLEFVITICFMIFLLPSFILSCVIVTNRFNSWKKVLENSNELQFSQIRSYIFHGRHLLHTMNQQWSFFVTITIFTTIPHILLQLYILVLTERHSSAMNQLFGWLWFIVIFIECSTVCYYGAKIHKSFETLSKSVVDLGSRTMIQGDEQFIADTTNANSAGNNNNKLSNSNKLYVNTPNSSTINDNQAKIIMMERCDTQISEQNDYGLSAEEEKTSDEETRKVLKINTKLTPGKYPYSSPAMVQNVNMVSNSNSSPMTQSTYNPLSMKGQNNVNITNSGNEMDQGISINLLLLLISSMNSIDGLVVGGIFTLNFGVIAKFLSALFTFGILFIELTRGES